MKYGNPLILIVNVKFVFIFPLLFFISCNQKTNESHISNSNIDTLAETPTPLISPESVFQHDTLTGDKEYNKPIVKNINIDKKVSISEITPNFKSKVLLTSKEKIELDSMIFKLKKLCDYGAFIEKKWELSFDRDLSVSLDSITDAYNIMAIELLSSKYSLYYSIEKFSSDLRMRVTESVDKRIRTFSWSPFGNGTYSKYYKTYVQIRTKNGDVVLQKPLRINNNEYGENIYETTKIQSKGITYYMFFSSDFEDKCKSGLVHIYTIDGDSLIHVPLFEKKDGNLLLAVRLGYPFDFSYDENTKVLQHNEIVYNSLWYVSTENKVKYKLIDGKFIKIEKDLKNKRTN